MKIEDLSEGLADIGGQAKKGFGKLSECEMERMIARLNKFREIIIHEKDQMSDAKSEKELPELFTIKEAAKYLKVSGQTIRNWMKVGDIEYHKLPGGGIRITKQAMNDTLLNLITPMAVCTRSYIWVDDKTRVLHPFEYTKLYKIVNENRIWIYLYNKDWGTIKRFGKKEFRKFFRIAADFEVAADRFEM